MSVGRRNCSEVADGFVSEELLSLRNMLSVLPFLPLLSSTPEEEVSPQKLSRFGNISAYNVDLVNFCLFLTRKAFKLPTFVGVVEEAEVEGFGECVALILIDTLELNRSLDEDLRLDSRL